MTSDSRDTRKRAGKLSHPQKKYGSSEPGAMGSCSEPIYRSLFDERVVYTSMFFPQSFFYFSHKSYNTPAFQQIWLCSSHKIALFYLFTWANCHTKVVRVDVASVVLCSNSSVENKTKQKKLIRRSWIFTNW